MASLGFAYVTCTAYFVSGLDVGFPFESLSRSNVYNVGLLKEGVPGVFAEVYVYEIADAVPEF